MTRYRTMAVPTIDIPRSMAVAHGRPIVTIRARRGGRRFYQEALAGFGPRGVQIVDADGYGLFVVASSEELARILEGLRDAPEGVEVNAWDDQGNRIHVEKGVR